MGATRCRDNLPSPIDVPRRCRCIAQSALSHDEWRQRAVVVRLARTIGARYTTNTGDAESSSTSLERVLHPAAMLFLPAWRLTASIGRRGALSGRPLAGRAHWPR